MAKYVNGAKCDKKLFPTVIKIINIWFNTHIRILITVLGSSKDSILNLSSQ